MTLSEMAMEYLEGKIPGVKVEGGVELPELSPESNADSDTLLCEALFENCST